MSLGVADAIADTMRRLNAVVDEAFAEAFADIISTPEPPQYHDVLVSDVHVGMTILADNHRKPVKVYRIEFCRSQHGYRHIYARGMIDACYPDAAYVTVPND